MGKDNEQHFERQYNPLPQLKTTATMQSTRPNLCPDYNVENAVAVLVAGTGH